MKPLGREFQTFGARWRIVNCQEIKTAQHFSYVVAWTIVIGMKMMMSREKSIGIIRMEVPVVRIHKN